MRGIPEAVLQVGVDSPSATYVYDLEQLRLRCQDLTQLCIPRKRVFFATMANDHPEILACVRDCGVGVFVNSPTHLSLVLELGFEPERIVYAASNMVPDEMRTCLDHRIALVLDSIGQIRALGKLADGDVEIGVRLNVGSAIDRASLGSDPGYRFGLLEEEIPQALDVASAHGIRIVGAHSYFGTDLMQADILLEGLERLCRTAIRLPDARYLDVGGGFGVPDTLGGPEFDLAEYGRRAAEILDRQERELDRTLELYIEPGRFLVADSGYFFVKVVDCKLRDDRVFVGTNGSVVNFPRPLLYPDRARHPCEIVGPRGTQPMHSKPVYVCGNSTYSQDFLARNLSLPLPEPGDTLVFHNAGAYGRSMITHFLGKSRPTEIVYDSAMADERMPCIRV